MRHSLVLSGFVGVVAGVLSTGCGNSNSPPPAGSSSTSASTSAGSSSTATSNTATTGISDAGPDVVVDSGPAVPVLSCTFDTPTSECSVPITATTWSLNNFADPANLAYVPADAGAPDGGDAGDAGGTDAGDSGAVTGGRPTLTVSTADGNPTPGALMLTATFTAGGQFVEPILAISPALDMTGKTLSADIRLVSVTGAATFAGGVQLYVDTTSSFCYTSVAAAATLPVGTWVPLHADVAAAAAGTACSGGTTSDPTQVVLLGVHFYSNPAPADGGAVTPVTAVFEIDNVVAQ